VDSQSASWSVSNLKWIWSSCFQLSKCFCFCASN